MFFIGIFGWKPRFSDAGDSAPQMAPCPACGAIRSFQRKTCRMWLEFFFIPVIPTGRSREVLVCSSCRWIRPILEPPPVEQPHPDTAEDDRKIHCIHCGARIERRGRTGWRTIRCDACDRSFEARV